MASIKRNVKHTLNIDDAKVTVAKIVADIKASYPSLIGSIDWNSDKTLAKIKGTGFKGTFKVTTDSMIIDISLGLLASAFKGRVEGKIDDKVKEYFS